MGHVAWKSRNMSFQPGCRSEIIAMITSATQPMSFPNSGIKSEYLTYLQMKKDASGTWAHLAVTNRDMRLPPRCKSEINSYNH